jgi:phosphate transport system permease protein
MTGLYALVLAILAGTAFFYGRRRGNAMRAGGGPVHSLPGYHGWLMALSVAIPMIVVFCIWSPLAPRLIEAEALAVLPPAMQPTDNLSKATVLREISNVLAGGALAESAKPEIKDAANVLRRNTEISAWAMLGIGVGLAATGFLFFASRLSKEYRARTVVERTVAVLLMMCSGVAILTTIGIVFSVLFETLHFFSQYPWYDFLFGTQWSPQIAMRSDQIGQSGAFGFIPLFVGTMLVMLIAMTVAVPVGVFCAIYMAEYASPRFRAIAKPVLEVLAGVPTVVFGFFAALSVAPFIRGTGAHFGLDVASESALAAGFVMGVMIIPFVSSLSDDVINAVPQSLRDGAFALGATKSETIQKVVLPAALPGIVSAIMLAISRAVGETMIVVMAAGLAGNLTFNPLEAVTTITVQIKTLLVGDQEFDSVKTLSAFALGFVLFFFTLILNVIALQIVKRYREQYD